ncbi:UvrD-helicase domain-containing protein [Pseudokineococcus basanitobsidens]|uniref:RecBCD enzyme subunit RecB n=1 Tax=Pseudokineococcus basanitobsidens TaxID=1926649 RepID=A0ABU8RGB1_9ACTN
MSAADGRPPTAGSEGAGSAPGAPTGPGGTSSAADAPAPFAVGDPLPTGTTLLEASAGTGKTWTIAALVARYVADAGLPVEDLLVMSFSRESTRELRERVRDRLVEARDALAPDAPPPGDDALLGLLRSGSVDDVALRHRRLSDALASFDAATVTTTHGFCQRVLLTLGAVADHDPRTELVEDLSDVVDEVADDLYLRKWGVPGAGEPALDAEAFRALARAAAADPASALLPDPAADDVPELPALRARVAGAVRDEVDRRLRRSGRLGYDHLLLRLARTLEDPGTGPVARRRMRRRYRVVLVDEFQDTDPVQWRVLRAAFHDAPGAARGEHLPPAPAPASGTDDASPVGRRGDVPRALVLVGDPKQAVYGFRGADVHAYLDAASRAQGVRTLAENHRSDAALLRGLDAVLGGAALGDPRIRVRPLTARHGERRLVGPPPVRLRVVPRAGLPLAQDGTARVAGARQRVVADVTARVVELLEGSARTSTPPPGSSHERPEVLPGVPADGAVATTGDAAGGRPLEPGEVAVLVRTNAQAQLVRGALEEAGVPVVVAGRTSVFSTPAAADWQVLLEALEQPHRSTRVRRLALGPFGGHDAASLDAGGDAVVDALALQVRAWARLLDARGVGALLEAVSRPRRGAPSLAARLLAEVGGERRVTDLRHVGQVLHEESSRGGLGLGALLAWLRERQEDATRDGGLERSRRLESDAAAVQVLTVHASKGLEFPAVLVPFAWDLWRGREPSTAVVHDEQGRRCRDVGGRGSPGWAAHVREHQEAETDEELRLAYVALTRASSHLLLWWAGTTNTERAPLHRLLLGAGAAGELAGSASVVPPSTVPPSTVAVPSDVDAFGALQRRAATSEGALVVEAVPLEVPRARWSPPPRARRPLSVAALGRPLDDTWRRTSYSALTAAAHEAVHGAGSAAPGAVVSEPEAVVEDDELGGSAPVGTAGGAAGPTEPDDPDAPLLDVATRWDGLGAGTRFGLLVHGVLEELDPAVLHDDGPSAALRACVAEQARAQGAAVDVDGLAAALDLALATPLGPLADEQPLAAVPAADRLPELSFELPLAGGDEPTAARPVLSGLVPLWREHCPDGPLAGYADALAALAPAELRGYLSGSIDAVLRVGGGGGHRYLVVDYKTNRLGVPDAPLTAWDYRPQALEDAMVAAHYPLQALLYQVALHRFLRWRLPGYDPARHLGGSLYLFVRGMVGADVRCADGSPPGVAAWRTPTGLVLATSDLLAGRSS